MAPQSRPLGCSRLRSLASPSYLKAHVTAKSVEELSRHNLLGFTQPDSLNQWPLRHALGDSLCINPSLSAASGELLQLLLRDRVEVRQPIHAVY
jgi:hypothetical protein